MRRAVFGPAGKGWLLFTLMLIVALTPQANAKPLSDGGFLGVYAREMDIALLEALDFDGDGVLIEDVVDESPANKAGIEPGDILTTFDGRTMTSPRMLRRTLWKTEPGQSVELGLWRSGKARTVKVELTDAPEKNYHELWSVDPEAMEQFFITGGKFLQQLDSTYQTMPKPGYLGVNMEKLGDQLAEYFDAGDNRALIETVKEDSPAEKAGLQAGDIIVQIDDEGVFEPSDVSNIISDHAKGDEVKITVLRKGKKKSFTATLDEREGFIWGKGANHLYIGDALHDLKMEMGTGDGFKWVEPESDSEVQIFRRRNAQ